MAKLWTPGSRITAARLNAMAESGTYTPQLRATVTNPNLGNPPDVVSGWWHRNGYFISGEVVFRFNTAGTGVSPGSGDYTFDLPFTPELSLLRGTSGVFVGSIIGHFGLRDNSALGDSRTGLVQLRSSQDVILFYDTGSVGGATSVKHNAPWTWAAGDAITASFRYPAMPSQFNP